MVIKKILRLSLNAYTDPEKTELFNYNTTILKIKKYLYDLSFTF